MRDDSRRNSDGVTWVEDVLRQVVKQSAALKASRGFLGFVILVCVTAFDVCLQISPVTEPEITKR
jgi:hypothetical protein